MTELLSIFTPAYNRRHTIGRTYESLKRQTCKDFCWLIIDDGSNDGTRQWVESLGEKIREEGTAFTWMGEPSGEISHNHFVIDADGMQIEYVYKSNGGLYTGYNVAFATIKTELCVCIDSDDYAPDDLVESIMNIWTSLSIDQQTKVVGLVGLDYNVVDKKPIGGMFDIDGQSAWVQDLHHKGDIKHVMRTGLMKQVCPQLGFEGEKDFNPYYMQMQVYDKYPAWIVNKNFCWVEYQIGGDSMSQAIFKQYKRSPKSYARYRLMEMSMTRGLTLKRKFQLAAHYISACIFSHDDDWLKKSKNKRLVLCAIPFGICYNILIRYRARK